MKAFRLLIALVLTAPVLAAQQAPVVADSGAARPSSPASLFAHVASLDLVTAGTDTVRKRPKAIEVSDAYEMRLRIHRYASYTMVPLFIAQSVAGNQLFQADKSGAERPGWASGVHITGAVGLGALFTLNTVTGVWNLWESRSNPVGRTKRWIHSALLLASDGGFAYTGIVLSGEAGRDQSKRTEHRNVAYYSMGAAVIGYAVMLIGDH